ncbi:AAA family ATPase [Vibrio rumoiensis]|uniref:SPOR domain-containing protein n=1 Tax=Vibrio rumoiensis 1S-45 TaxID=1188252 RepID=A0A1E5E6V0_9VIBR|nr:AAA family ATPase [Vibrio rumoiensis]OEF30069.1 hypothetical protein A1QC_03515 [Vibrio rumoiensis 1S-45]
MSVIHGAGLVQLESQAEILEGLQLFTRFHSNVILVEGEPGSGKSWIAQRFLDTDKEIQTLSFLICLPSQSVDQQRSVLMSQLLSDSFCIGEETLLQSLEAYRKEQECNATIIVDDAELLAPNLLHELCELVVAAQHHPLWQINVMVFAKPNTIDEVLVEETSNLDIKSLVIQPLTNDEANRFLEQLVMPNISSAKKRDEIYQTASRIENWPSDLLALENHQKYHGSPWIRYLLIALIVLLITMGAWSWWASYQARMQDQLVDDVTLQQSEVQAENANRDLPLNTVSAAVSSAVSAETDGKDKNAYDASNLPQSVTGDTLTVGDLSASDQKRVVVPSNVIDALMDGDAPKDAKKAVPSTTNKEPVTGDKPEPATKLKSAINSTSGLVLANQELMDISEQRYTLQLGALTDEQSTIHFIKTHKLEDKVRVYKTIRNQKPWYIVTYQDFSSIKESREAGQELPLELQKELPWPKSMAQVHQEIERVQ